MARNVVRPERSSRRTVVPFSSSRKNFWSKRRLPEKRCATIGREGRSVNWEGWRGEEEGSLEQKVGRKNGKRWKRREIDFCGNAEGCPSPILCKCAQTVEFTEDVACFCGPVCGKCAEIDGSKGVKEREALARGE